jgi:HSP20 family protein
MEVEMAEGVWSVFEDMDRLRREINRVLGDVGTGWSHPFSRVSFLPARAPRAYPLVNIFDEEERYLVEALAPGLDPVTIDITVLENRLAVSGTKEGMPAEIETDCCHRAERAAGRFQRTINLPGEIDRERIEAEYVNGLLRISLPKSEKARPKKIQVKVG